jgi:hypothetical protein
MPFFLLHPIPARLSDRDWEGSSHHGDCYVMAAGERLARESASATFGRAIAPPSLPGEGRTTRPPTSPWLQPRLVEVTETGRYRDDLAFGTVLIPDSSRG